MQHGKVLRNNSWSNNPLVVSTEPLKIIHFSKLKLLYE
jgi:hypothetical protein